MKKSVLLLVVLLLSLSVMLIQPAVAQTTLRVLVHQNPPMVEFMEAFNEKFQQDNPGIVIDMSVVNANDLSTVTQTRLSANDIDVIDMFGFSNGMQPYMKNVDAPNWQQLADAGLLTDLTDQPFIANYDDATMMPPLRTRARTTARFIKSTLGAFPTAAFTTTRICSQPITSPFRRHGTNWCKPAKPSPLLESRA